MKKITQKEIEIVKEELAAKRKEFDEINFSSLEKKLKWIRNFFNSYVPELEQRYMDEWDFENYKFLPDELRIHFYLYFPEHGLNMVHFAEKCARKLEGKRKFKRNKKVVPRFTQSDIERLSRPKSMEEFEGRVILRHQD